MMARKKTAKAADTTVAGDASRIETASGPKPIVIFLILIGCILLIAMLFAVLRVFVLPAQHLDPCVVRGPLPDPDCTPGAVLPATKEQVCVPGYATSVRNVSQSLKNKIYASYGIVSHKPYEYEIDHLISLSLGGSNDQSNLFPEAAEPRPGYHEKDKVEMFMYRSVCNGSMNLSDAQRIIATNWTMMLDKVGGMPTVTDTD
jgi:hypothetical protein